MMTDLCNKREISVIICCHNSSERLPQTLQHLSSQVVDSDISWEIIVVDNASTDNTKCVARNTWRSSDGVPFRVVDEPKLGLMNARVTGMRHAVYDTVGFIDDDNWVATNWINIASSIMADNPQIGVCGGFNEAIAEGSAPFWFDRFSRSYATGVQEEEPGDATHKKGFVFGAGMLVNKKAFFNITDDGFVPILMGRQGGSLTCGEDYEICLALRLAGWKIWYEPELRLKHYIPRQRLNWQYLRNVYRIVGTSSLGLDPYHMAYSGSGGRGRLHMWQSQALKSILRLLKRSHIYLASRVLNLEGKRSVLLIEREIGRLRALLVRRNDYDNDIERVRTAKWVTTPLGEV